MAAPFFSARSGSCGTSSAARCDSKRQRICPTSRNPYPVRKVYKKSYQLSKYILDAVCKATGADSRGVYASDDYTGINWSEVPVTILEMGYMSNYTEDRLMATASYQDKIIKGIVNGLNTYFKKK